MPGTYQVGDPNGPVAVCALTSEKLVSPLVGVQGVAIAGIVYTANLGITRIIATSHPILQFVSFSSAARTRHYFDQDNPSSLYPTMASMAKGALFRLLDMIQCCHRLIPSK
jgi:hypothetical protein